MVLATFESDWSLWLLIAIGVIVASNGVAALGGLWTSRTVVGVAVALVAANVATGVVVRACPVGNIGLVLSLPVGLAAGLAAAAPLRFTALRYRLGGLDRSLRSSD